ncbi:MAG: GDSL-type esterase/lipase family protein [Brevundimonas sp.]|nr:GDSL-type esterase/lipase family protein [Brevundimonas sp.]
MAEDTPVGMVDSLPGNGGPAEDALAFATAYVADGEMDAALLAALSDPEKAAERERRKALQRQTDWANLGYYREENAALAGQKTDVVFMGDSITEMWRIAQPELFTDGIVNRGISGQTSAQMLVRFTPDVIALKPRVVHLMCGVNDVAGNTGPTTPQDLLNAINAMVDLAQAHGIEVILGTLTPVTGLPWAPAVQDPRGRVVAMNAEVRALAARRDMALADYFAVLADDGNALKSELTRDGVHPTGQGYREMRPLADAALKVALRR